jgi:dihydrolipoamide dehydrogenase
MADSASFDVVVIGSGPGGYVAAIRCAQLGMKTALVERYPSLGGTCLNVGCIPSKALLDSSEHFYNATHAFADHGITVTNPTVDLAKMIARKEKVVEQTVAGVAFLMKKNKITVYAGHGTFTSSTALKVALNAGGEAAVSAKHFIIATGSKPSSLPGVAIDKQRIITSTEALKLGEIPKRMVLIGAGVIGLEMGSVYARLGTKVTVVEYMDAILPTMDRELGKEMERILRKHLGFEFFFSHKVTGAEVQKPKKGAESVIVKALDKDGKEVSFEGDYCLVAVGRRPYTDNLGLDVAGVKVDAKGKVEVNDHLETNVPGIWAIGDVVRGAMLAHKASDEGVFVAERIAGQKPHIAYHCIPNVVYTWPEVAAVGYTEEELKAKGVAYKKGRFDYRNLGRARASGDVDGFVKILADATTDEVLGIHMIGPRTADLIAEAVTALEFRASAEDLAIMSHAHPTYAEATKEAALAATANRALHM